MERIVRRHGTANLPLLISLKIHKIQQMENSVNDRIVEIFYELKEQKLIDTSRKIKIDSKLPGTFKAGLIFRNTISYNPQLCKTLSDDVIRFCLLHEEGHMAQDQYGPQALIILWGIGLIPLIYSVLLKIGGIIAIFSVCFAIFVIFSSIQILKDSLYRDEYGSDEFASKILQDKCGVRRPSEVVKKTFDSLPQIIDSTNRWHRLFVAFFDYHPSKEQRVRNIQELVDK